MPADHVEQDTTRPGSTAGDVVAEDHPMNGSIGRPRSRDWDRTLTDLADISDETDTDEVWSEVLRTLGVGSEAEGE